MNIFVKINGVEYPAQISGHTRDRMNIDADGTNRETKDIHAVMSYAEAAANFVDGAAWSIVMRGDNGEYEEYDNSDFNVAGAITDYRDGTVNIKMGKPTDLEQAYELLYGGDTQ